MGERWIRVTKRDVCPMCGRPDWCMLSPDRAVCLCMRSESAWSAKQGGWYHKLTADMPKPIPPPRTRPTWISGEGQEIDFASIMRDYRMKTDDLTLHRHAMTLGVTADSLRFLGAAWAGPYRAWAFPMLDAQAKVVGIRLRSEKGDKWAVTGSHQGLFVPAVPLTEPVVICEGPTDTAAAISLGFFAIGRPSCNSCVDMVVELMRKKDVVIMGDRDQPKERPNGTIFLPGQEGAKALALALFEGRARSVKIIYPLRGKDARAWLRAGATRGHVLAAIKQKSRWQPSGAVGNSPR